MNKRRLFWDTFYLCAKEAFIWVSLVAGVGYSMWLIKLIMGLSVQ
jgi:hypothetical protein